MYLVSSGRKTIPGYSSIKNFWRNYWRL